MNEIANRIRQLREEMLKRGISVYVVPTADFHESEYVGEYFKARAFLTGFTGSAGTAVITMTEAGLWTDARYFLQAEQQLAGSGITLYRMGEEGVPTILQYLEAALQENEILGFDGRVVSAELGRKFAEIAESKKGQIYATEDLVDSIWDNRPKLSAQQAWILQESYAGESMETKLHALRQSLKEKKATVHLLTSLYDICWLLNIRGNDISYVPVVLSYLAVRQEECIWFVQKEAVSAELCSVLSEHQIRILPYESFYDYVQNIPAGEIVWLDGEVVNYRVRSSIPNGVSVVDLPNPTVRMRAVRNPKQMENIQKAHLKDAVAMCKFMYWLKTNIGKQTMTELSAAKYLEQLRRQQEGFLELSFETISGYAEHGAIVHYAVTEETDVELKPEGLLLVDSGGHYLEGTTDITRTFALGPLSEQMKSDFTRVCRANINLAAARFLKGCTGRNLDILAREPLWEAELDYKHGTGHGVGYVLNVHEGPNAFRWKKSQSRSDDAVLVEGMVTTDEPGLYIAGQYGIRTENELLCREGNKNEYGQFMYFENLTYVPIDLDAMDASQMTETEKQRLNDYHAMVYEKVSPYLEGEEREFLKHYTRAVK